MIFEKFNITHLEKFNNITKEKPFFVFGSEYNFTVMHALKDFQNFTCSTFDGSLIIMGEHNGKIYFCPPVSKDGNSFIKAVEKIRDYCKQIDRKFEILWLTEKMVNLFKDNSLYNFEEVRDNAEYLYLPSDLIDLAGKKYHSKRNFLNTFKKTYTYNLRKYEESDLVEVAKLIKKWEESKYSYSAYEENAILSTLKNREILNAICNVLIINGNMAGFIIASVDINLDVNLIFEKADISYKGVYAVMLNEFIKNNFSNYRYVNMQEDMGIVGLRKSKLSYYPEKLLKKFNMTLKNG